MIIELTISQIINKRTLKMQKCSNIDTYISMSIMVYIIQSPYI